MFTTNLCQRILLLACVLALPCAAAFAAALGPANALGQYRYLVEFDDPGMLEAVERLPGQRFDADSEDAIAHRSYLMSRHAELLADMSAALGRVPEVSHVYLATHSGMALWLTAAEAESVRDLTGVAAVDRERIETVDTHRGPTFIGADQIWSGNAVPNGVPSRGEGVVVAILDTGVDPDHPSFANDASCGHGENGARPKLISLVDCLTTDASGRCNGPLPFDTQSHGSHVAGTAAGNRLDQGTSPPPGSFDEISGVAPCAHIRSYKVCPDLSCPASLIQAGMNTVLLDGDVQVMNFSISGGRNPWGDNDRRKLDLVGADVMVAASAGNTGPTIANPVGQVNHLGPWVFTIAASTHDGGSVPVPHLSAAGPGVPPEDTQRLVLTDASADPDAPPAGEPFAGKPIRRAADDALQIDDEGCAPFTPGYFQGAVALIQRGTCSFVVKVQNAQAAGADMIVIRNNEPGALTAFTVGVTPEVPVYGMSMADGEALARFIAEHPTAASANFEFIAASGQGDVLAGFSLRGPTPAPLQHLTKPDITAPGVAIFAAEPGLLGLLPPGYGYKSGTSMSGPHAAGAAALVRAVHPDWSAVEVKSAIMMTGFLGGTREDGSTPWNIDDVGSGRVELGRAALAGLVMHENHANYLAANPASGGDVRTLNIPALRNVDCTPSCTWTRTVRSTLDVPASWTVDADIPGVVVQVSPASFTFDGDRSATQDITITAIADGDRSAAIVFGNLVLRESQGLSPDLRFSMAVRGVGDPGVDPVDPPSMTEIDDADPAVEYRRGWHRVDNVDASFGGFHRRMGAAGGGEPPSARLVFEGSSITYHYATSRQGGSADVFIDGEFMATVDYAGDAPGDAPAFGHAIGFEDLGEGRHELLIVFRSGAVYVDGFVITSDGHGGADATAAETRSSTSAGDHQISGLTTSVILQTVDVGPDDEWLSVVVESSAAVTVGLLDPLGTLIASGEQLVPASNAQGLDLAPLLAGPYTVQVTGAAGSSGNVRISITRTISIE
jgi:subtilisin family serine protease